MKNVLSLRRISQFSVLAIVLFLTISHMKYGIEKAASIDAYCPFGAIEGFWTYLTTGEYLKRIYTSVFVLMGIVAVLTLLFGRVFCSHLCPLGALQEWLRGLGRKLGIQKDIELPKFLDKFLRYLKYVVLAVVVYFSFKTGELIFRGYDPFNALMHLGEEFEEKIAGYVILVLVLFFAIFSKSWWCRYLCPFGAFMGLLRKISPFAIVRDENSCVGCGSCNNVCPAGLEIKDAKEIKSADCISCLNCVSNCKKSSLKISILGKTFSKKYFSIAAVAFFFLSLAIFMSTSLWQTKAPSNIVKNTGELDATNVRGSNTLEYLIETTKIPYTTFQDELGLPEKIDLTLKLKDIGPKYDLKKEDGTYLEAEDFREVMEKYAVGAK